MAITAFLCLFLLSLVSAYPQQIPSGRRSALASRVSGGVVASIEDYPYVVAIGLTELDEQNQTAEYFVCAASIATKDYVITAAYCIDQYDFKASELFITAGSASRLNGTKYLVEEIIYHPKYTAPAGNDPVPNYDVCLLKLKTSLVLSSSVKSVTLPSSSLVLNTGTMLTVLGWGATGIPGGLEELLREASVPVMSKEECAEGYSYLVNNDTMFCTTYTAGSKADACSGDAGGPIVLNSTQVGLLSWGIGCALSHHFPRVNANVIYVSDWIRSVTGL